MTKFETTILSGAIIEMRVAESYRETKVDIVMSWAVGVLAFAAWLWMLLG